MGRRLLYDNAGGTLGAPLAATSGTDTITFAEVPPFNTLTGGDYIALALDTYTGSGNAETGWLTDYTQGESTGQLLRGQEGTSPQVHNTTSGPSGGAAIWGNNPTVVDFAGFGQWLYGTGVDGAFTATNARQGTLILVRGSDVVESPDINFTDADIGQAINSLDFGISIGLGAVITAIIDAQHAVMSAEVNADATLSLVGQVGGIIYPGQYTTVTIPAGVTTRVSSWLPNFAGTNSNGATPNAPGGLPQQIPYFQCTESFTIEGTLDLSGADAVGMGDSVQGQIGNPDGCGASSGWGALYGGYTITFNGDTGAGQGTGNGSLFNDGPPGGDGGNSSNATGGRGDRQTLPYFQGWQNPFYLIPFASIGSTGQIGGLAGSIPGECAASGAGDGTYNGGGGGEGGQGVVIFARHIIHGPDNLYNLQGGRGGDAGDDGSGDVGNGDCGSGGGGGGGWWMTVSDDISGSAIIAGTGGDPGTPSGTGTSGTAGTSGLVIHAFNRADGDGL